MSEEQLGGRTTVTVVATAAVTLAIGVTAAALGGYFVPNRAAVLAQTEPATTAETAEAAPTPRPAAGVVFVPIAPDSQREPPQTTLAQAGSEAFIAATAEPHEHDSDEVGKRRHHRDHRDEDEHDDED